MTTDSDLEKIRGSVDGEETFLTGHSVRSTRWYGRSLQKKVPVWAKSDVKVQAVLLRAFPKLMTDEKQRRRAAIWARVIYLYYRLGFTYGQVAEEMGIKTENAHRPYAAIESIIRSISRASRGVRCDTGSSRTHRGRPRKIHAVNTAPLRNRR